MNASPGDGRGAVAAADPPASPPATPSADPAASASPELARIKYGAWLIGAAFLLLGAVFGVAVAHFSTAADVTSAVGSVAPIVGTIVGAFFGVQAGSSGKEAAIADRTKAESTAREALARLDPEKAGDLLGKL